MAYFNHAFYKSFLATDASAADGTKTSALAAGQLALVDGKDWTAHATGAFPAPGLAYLVQGSLHASDTIAGNKNHGGYAESVKSKGINPRYLTRVWESTCVSATAATVEVEVEDTFRGKKVIAFKYKKRKQYSRTVGHRQTITRVVVKAIKTA